MGMSGAQQGGLSSLGLWDPGSILVSLSDSGLCRVCL